MKIGDKIIYHEQLEGIIESIGINNRVVIKLPNDIRIRTNINNLNKKLISNDDYEEYLRYKIKLNKGVDYER